MNRAKLQQELKVSSADIALGFARALAEAKTWRGSTSPNPPVGCAALDAGGNVLALAAHKRTGERHAEALVIEQCRVAGSIGRIDTLLVTLEPCNHTGRTPPCSEAILATPCRAVWIASRDPNPRVAGGGAKRLAAAGLEVQMLRDLAHADTATLQREADLLIAPFAKRVTKGMPWITVKQAVDVSGSMIPPTGQKTFTSPSSLKLAHELRKRADAILTGSGTILADNPEFTVRHVPDFAGKQRKLLIADRRVQVPQSYVDVAIARGFDVMRIIDVASALKQAAVDGANEVLIEAGPSITEAVLSSDLWDEHVLIVQQTNAPDCITTRYRTMKDEAHVFRNH
jgi:diaminohydroxyphosphoribosylaminopyrimidine deaminase / 5-amino-6-(5-phosphoribosylamino)uracil reductase